MVVCYDPQNGKFCDFSTLKEQIDESVYRMFPENINLDDFSVELNLNDERFFINCFCRDDAASINVYRKILTETFVFEIEKIFTVFINYGSKNVKNPRLRKVWDYIEEKTFLRFGKILSDLKTPFIIVYRHEKASQLDEETVQNLLNAVYLFTAKIEKQIKK
ncbi:hypothetical protein [Persephonella sp.]